MDIVPSPYLTEKSLDNLRYYKYGAVDLSPISKHIMQPYWSWAVTLFPLWMAPNLITLIGLSFVFVNVLFVIWMVPDLIGPGPPWLYFSFCAGLWLYSTFDNVDGKQARRTGTSSPLGELFDHGCDALNCSFGIIVQAATLGLGQSWMVVKIGGTVITAFYLSTWEEYYTGVMNLGYINGPTEGLLMACISMIVTGIYGPGVWKLPTDTFLPAGVTLPYFGKWALLDFILAQLLFTLFVFNLPTSLYNVWDACRKKNKSFTVALLQGPTSFIVFTMSTYCWASAPGSIAVSKNCILFVLTAGIVFARITTKIILAYVCKGPHPWGTLLIGPLTVGAILTNSKALFGRPLMTPGQEEQYLWASFVVCLICYVNANLVIIQKFCAHLNINCLTIPSTANKNK